MQFDDPILIFGAGSIGERHIRNLWALGYRNITVFRQRNLPFRDIADAQVRVITDKEKLHTTHALVAFICTPSAQHAEQILFCAEHNMHVFVEKPMTSDNAHIEDILTAFSEKDLLLQVGFMMRFHPALLEVKRIREENRYGKLLHMRSHWGSYLPAWHPWEDHRQSYAARTDLGGGVALTLCHDIDVAIWIAGMQQTVFTSIQKKAESLEIEAPAIANILLSFPDDVQAEIHLNYLDDPPVRTYHFHFEQADIHIPYFENKMIIRSEKDGEIIKWYSDFDRNDMFLDEVNAFFNRLNSGEEHRNYTQQHIRESANITDICTV